MFSGIVQEFSKKTEVKSKDYGINLSVRVTKNLLKVLRKETVSQLTEFV